MIQCLISVILFWVSKNGNLSNLCISFFFENTLELLSGRKMFNFITLVFTICQTKQVSITKRWRSVLHSHAWMTNVILIGINWNKAVLPVPVHDWTKLTAFSLEYTFLHQSLADRLRLMHGKQVLFTWVYVSYQIVKTQLQ